MFGKIGFQELLIVLVIVVIMFGPKQLPKLGETFGKTIKGFRKEMDMKETDESKTDESKTEE